MQELPDAYRPAPSVSRLVTEITQEVFWARHATVRGDAGFHPEYIAQRERTALLLRAVIADLFAVASPGDERAAMDAAQAALTVRRADDLPPCDPETARAWLRKEFTAYETSEAPHPPNCPGRCRGTGEVMAILTYSAEGVPLHEEPVACDRGEPADPHLPDCRCGGSGEWEVCLTYRPEPEVADSLGDHGQAHDSAPSATAPQPPATATASPYDEPPF